MRYDAMRYDAMRHDAVLHCTSLLLLRKDCVGVLSLVRGHGAERFVMS